VHKAELDVFEYAGLTMYIEQLFRVPVDVVDRDALKPHLRQSALAQSLPAF
jgi:uncharacterized protein